VILWCDPAAALGPLDELPGKRLTAKAGRVERHRDRVRAGRVAHVGDAELTGYTVEKLDLGADGVSRRDAAADRPADGAVRLRVLQGAFSDRGPGAALE
jgi:hypothetical protein